ncbi:MAG TPA: hypothetical protein VGP47_05385 [Parachlamydiaceae bacterium]|nr:hypothetical protein [Parachlamydiaceae bacterium]
MKSQGIRIEDKVNNVVNVGLLDILKEIEKGYSFYWSILFLDFIGNLGENRPNPSFSYEINESKNGFRIGWMDLNSLSSNCEQIIDIIVLGCKDQEFLKRYEDDQEMYETCDFVIEMVDSTFWEVFSKDESLIKRLAAKFKTVEFLETNYKENFY